MMGFLVALLLPWLLGGAWLACLWRSANWVLLLGYLGVFLMWSALSAVFITQPLLAHYATTLTIHQASELTTVRQREQDDFVEAEGFADALDVGGAF